MRLGGHCDAPATPEALRALTGTLDRHGLSTVLAPARLAEMDEDECAALGRAAEECGVAIGEIGFWENLLTDDPDLRRRRIDRVRTLLRKADAMGCRCVVTLVGTKDRSDHPLAPHPALTTPAARAEFREVVLRIMDGLDLRRARYAIEPWCNTFYHEPEDCRAFLDTIDHPAVGHHMDLMNMVSLRTYHDTAGLARRAFALLADRTFGVHLKDLRWDHRHMYLKWDEVLVGDGVLDYDAYLRHVAALPQGTCCFCEHLSEAQYLENFARLHRRAAAVGAVFLRRGA